MLNKSRYYFEQVSQPSTTPPDSSPNSPSSSDLKTGLSPRIKCPPDLYPHQLVPIGQSLRPRSHSSYANSSPVNAFPYYMKSNSWSPGVGSSPGKFIPRSPAGVVYSPHAFIGKRFGLLPETPRPVATENVLLPSEVELGVNRKETLIVETNNMRNKSRYYFEQVSQLSTTLPANSSHLLVPTGPHQYNPRLPSPRSGYYASPSPVYAYPYYMKSNSWSPGVGFSQVKFSPRSSLGDVYSPHVYVGKDFGLLPVTPSAVATEDVVLPSESEFVGDLGVISRKEKLTRTRSHGRGLADDDQEASLKMEWQTCNMPFDDLDDVDQDDNIGPAVNGFHKTKISSHR